MQELSATRYVLPGPRSQQILARKERAVLDALSIHLPAVIERGEGAVLVDVDGHTFIDLAGGVGVMNVGHSHPRVLQTIARQTARFTHTDFTVAPYDSYVELAERLCALAPVRGPAKAAFFNSGAEAVENAVKVARLATGRPAVIAFEGGFHGRTWMALTLTSKVEPYKHDLGPFVPEVYRVPFPYVYRSPRPTEAETVAYTLRRLEEAFVTQVQADRVAAVIIEPVLGEGGFVPAPVEFLRRLRDLCDRHGIVLIDDEVQTGYGRTGAMFAFEHAGVEADVVVVAKSIAAGFPLSGVIASARLADRVPDGAVGGTYVGNPVACAVGLEVLRIIEDEGLVDRASRIGARIRDRFEAMRGRYALVGDARGVGAMQAIELVRDRETKEPARDETSAILRGAMERGVLLLRAGIHGNVIRTLAPLVITDEQLDRGLDVLEECVAEAQRAHDAGRKGPTEDGATPK